MLAFSRSFSMAGRDFFQLFFMFYLRLIKRKWKRHPTWSSKDIALERGQCWLDETDGDVQSSVGRSCWSPCGLRSPPQSVSWTTSPGWRESGPLTRGSSWRSLSPRATSNPCLRQGWTAWLLERVFLCLRSAEPLRYSLRDHRPPDKCPHQILWTWSRQNFGRGNCPGCSGQHCWCPRRWCLCYLKRQSRWSQWAGGLAWNERFLWIEGKKIAQTCNLKKCHVKFGCLLSMASTWSCQLSLGSIQRSWVFCWSSIASKSLSFSCQGFQGPRRNWKACMVEYWFFCSIHSW